MCGPHHNVYRLARSSYIYAADRRCGIIFLPTAFPATPSRHSVQSRGRDQRAWRHSLSTSMAPKSRRGTAVVSSTVFTTQLANHLSAHQPAERTSFRPTMRSPGDPRDPDQEAHGVRPWCTRAAGVWCIAPTAVPLHSDTNIEVQISSRADEGPDAS